MVKAHVPLAGRSMEKQQKHVALLQKPLPKVELEEQLALPVPRPKPVSTTPRVAARNDVPLQSPPPHQRACSKQESKIQG